MKFDDLTKVNVPFGLLDEATQEALRAHGGPYEIFTGGGGWRDHKRVDFTIRNFAYRVAPAPIAPKVESFSEEMWMRPYGSISKIEYEGFQPVRVTFNRIDGVIDLASYKVESR